MPHDDAPISDADSMGPSAPAPDNGIQPPVGWRSPPLDDPPYAEWPQLGLHIARGAAAYVAVLTIGIAALELLALVWALLNFDPPSPAASLAGVLFLAIGAAIAALAAVAFTAVVGVPVLASVWMTIRTLGIKARWRDIGGFSGSLVAYVICFPFLFIGLHDLLQRIAHRARVDLAFDILLPLGFGPFLALLCLQVGGAIGGVRLEQDRAALHQPVRPYGEGGPSFGLRQLMRLLLYASLLLAALRAARVLDEITLLLTACWCGWYLLTRRPVCSFALWLIEWQAMRSRAQSRGRLEAGTPRQPSPAFATRTGDEFGAAPGNPG